MNDKSLEKNKKSEFLNLDKDDEYVEYEEEVEENENQHNLKGEYNFDKEKEFYE